MERDLNVTIVHDVTKMDVYTIQSSAVVGLVKRLNRNRAVVEVVAVVNTEIEIEKKEEEEGRVHHLVRKVKDPTLRRKEPG